MLSCRQDIDDIVERDRPAVEKAFDDWCRRGYGYDGELRSKITPLLKVYQLGDAIRASFIVLAERLRSKCGIADVDGEDLVNRIFGKTSHAATDMSTSCRQHYRNLLSGLYALYRNRTLTACTKSVLQKPMRLYR